MIDTVRFKMLLTRKQYEKIRSVSKEMSETDNESGSTSFRVLKKNVPIGSYDRNISIYVSDEHYCYIEFSVPKYLYGHNVFLVYPEQVPSICESLQKKFYRFFGDFPATIWWELERVDLCYAWKLPSHEDAVKVLSLLQNISGGRTHKFTYNSSVMFKGGTMTTKFYLKDDEYYKHDFVELKKSGFIDMAYKYLAISQGVLRFEISLRKQAINRLFYGVESGDCYWISWLFTTEACTHILNRRMSDLMKCVNKKLVTLDQVHDKLVAVYGKTKGFHLYSFYRIYYNDEFGVKKIRKSMTYQQVWYNLKKLNNAGVGVASDETPLSFDLDIPSKYVVNDTAPKGAVAER